MEIHTEDLDSYFQKESETYLLDNILKNTRRYIRLFTEAADQAMPTANVQFTHDDIEPFDEIITHQRLSNFKHQTDINTRQNPKAMIPPELTRR